jgi:hypothetical protein
MRKLFATLLLCALVPPAQAKDKGQWDLVGHPPEVKQWFRSLVQPPTAGRGMGGGGTSCCGESDAYYADEVRVRNGKMYAVITDERDDKPLGDRAHEKVGTEYEVPPRQIVGQEQYGAAKGNPTGHVIIFLGGPSYDQSGERMQPRTVLCYVPNGGV